MNIRAFSHLGNQVLLRRLEEEAAHNRESTATMIALIALIAEVDERQLYLSEGDPSMYSYCVRKLGMSEDAALKRIRVARIARRFPTILDAMADGRLHLSGVVMLRRHLTAENGVELLAAAERKTKAEIGQLIAQRFPRPELLEWVQPVSSSWPAPPADTPASEHVQELPGSLAPGPVEATAPRTKVTPIAPQRFALQVMLDQSTHDKLRYAQSLLGHVVPSGEIAAVLERALDALIVQLEKRKFAATGRPRPSQRCSANPRHIPAHVKRAVWERDGGHRL